MQWCNIGSNVPSRDDFGLGLNRNLKGFERYRMSGSDEEGDYTLDIDSVTLEDDAKFQCQVLEILHHHHQLTSYTLDIVIDSFTRKVDDKSNFKVGAAPGGVEPIRSRYSFLTVTGRSRWW